MNECAKYQELISCLIDGEITCAEESELNAHIEHCCSCKTYLEIVKEISGPEPVEPPAELSANVMKAVRLSAAGEPMSKKNKKSRRFGGWIAAAACFVIIAAAVPTLTWCTGSGAPEAANGGVNVAAGTETREYEPAEGSYSDAKDSAELRIYEENGSYYTDYTAEYSEGGLEDAEEEAVREDSGPMEDGGDIGCSGQDEPMNPAAAAVSDTEAKDTGGDAEQGGLESDNSLILPEPSPMPAPEKQAYRAVIRISGVSLPETIDVYEKAENADGTYSIEVPYAFYDELSSVGEVSVVDESSENDVILVIYEPEREA